MFIYSHSLKRHGTLTVKMPRIWWANIQLINQFI